MARSACAAFGGCCSARTSWFPCALLCVLLGLVSLPCVGGLEPSCFAACVSPSFGLFLFLLARSLLLVCGAGGGGGVACRSLHPIAAVGLSHSQLGGAKGTGHFCTGLQIYKMTCQWCCCSFAFWAAEGLPV